MARLPRLSFPGYPHHVIQRGNNRQPIFQSGLRIASLFLDLAARERHPPWCRRPWLRADGQPLSPAGDAGGRGRVVALHAGAGPALRAPFQRCARALGHAVGRPLPCRRCCRPERYLLPCLVYFDLNPVRDGLVVQAQDYPWSSHAHYAGLRVDKLPDAPSAGVETRQHALRPRVALPRRRSRWGCRREQLDLTESALSGWALGDPEFVARLQQLSQRRLTQAGRLADRRGNPERVPAPLRPGTVGCASCVPY
jgi:putative transposase